MDEIRFPFPNFSLAMRELQADPIGGRLILVQQEALRDKAWTFGREAARMVYARAEGESDFWTLLEKSGLRVLAQPRDCVIAGRRYFAIFESGRDTVEIYKQAVALWADENDLTYSEAENLILSHEYFHYLEARELGFASALADLPFLRIGTVAIGKKGIRVLSEIGAHAFARTYYELCRQEKAPTAQCVKTKEEIL